MILTEHTFEIIDHTADLGIVAAGSNLKELFQNASHAMMRIMLEEVPEESGETTKRCGSTRRRLGNKTGLRQHARS